MSPSKFNSPAELFSSRSSRAGRFSGLRHRRFDTLAEAVKYAVEEIPAQLSFATIDCGGSSFRGAEIRSLYGRPDFPLPRA